MTTFADLAVAVVCRGRHTTTAGRPDSPICGTTFTAHPRWDGTRYIDPTPGQHLDAARAAGWSVAGLPMCPDCRRPDSAITRNLTRPATRKDQP